MSGKTKVTLSDAGRGACIMLQEAEKLDVEVNEALQNMLAWQEIMRQKISERDACLVAAKKFSHYVVDPN